MTEAFPFAQLDAVPVTLPIVKRELRVRARQGATFWVRAGVGLLGLATLLGTLGTPGGITAVRGKETFVTLSWLLLLFCFVEGIRLTYDTLGRERREGTLGLLFLTDLHGYDVVLGKLVTAGWTAFQGILALVPVLAVPLLLGGVNAGDVARTSLALLNALFMALALGLWASARSPDGNRALLLAGGLGAAWLTLPVFMETVRWQILSRQNASPLFLLLSPLAPLWSICGGRLSSAHFLWTLGLTHLSGWLLLGGAVARTRRAWRESEIASSRPGDGRVRRFRECPPNTPPLQWLLTRHPRRIRQGWTAAFLLELPLFLPFLMTLLGTPFSGDSLSFFMIPIGMFCFGNAAIMLTSLVCRPVAELRESGLAELLLGTPVTAREFQTAWWAALRRPVLQPVLILLAVETAIMLIQTNEPGEAALNAAASVAWLMALCQVGARLAATLRRPSRAMALTLVLVTAVPALGWMLLPWPLVLTAMFPTASPGALVAFSYGVPLFYWVILWDWAHLPLWPLLRRTVAQAPPARNNGRRRFAKIRGS